MNPVNRVVHPPNKAIVIYDGECTFCCLLIQRWRHVVGDSIDYLPLQDPRVATRFPELSPELLETAVHLVERDGSVFRGARAALGALAHGSNPRQRALLGLYEGFPAFAVLAEWVYGLIARHRRIFSFLVRRFSGRSFEPRSYDMVRWFFLSSIGIIYLIAFLSLWTQLNGLVSSQGLLPVQNGLETIRQATAQSGDLQKYHLFPTLCWLNSSDAFLHVQCALGTVLAILLIIRLAPALCLFLLWLLYLSLATVNREFLGFQWDNLLLETGFLAIFLAPLQLRPWRSRVPPPSSLVILLFRWLLFRLMFESGCVKLLSGDPAWRHLTALAVHYQTQPLPTWFAWYAHQLPAWAHKISAALMFGIELFVPFLIFGPRRLRMAAFMAFLVLQTFIFLTGNYCFFNLLTVALSLFLLDDSALMKLIPSKGWRLFAFKPQLLPSKLWKWPRQITIPLAIVILIISAVQFATMFRIRLSWPQPVLALYRGLSPLRTFNSYGLFAVMTMERPEIIIQGSNDGKNWSDYEFKYKPGDVKRRPKFVEPHQPRVDWQMWFAALGNYRQNPWFINLCVNLLENSPQALSLMKSNPFAIAPPRYVRALVYEYHFTDWSTRRRTGAWWERELRGVYMPVLALRE